MHFQPYAADVNAGDCAEHAGSREYRVTQHVFGNRA